MVLRSVRHLAVAVVEVPGTLQRVEMQAQALRARVMFLVVLAGLAQL